jgi:hypothetical protein
MENQRFANDVSLQKNRYEYISNILNVNRGLFVNIYRDILSKYFRKIKTLITNKTFSCLTIYVYRNCCDLVAAPRIQSFSILNRKLLFSPTSFYFKTIQKSKIS